MVALVFCGASGKIADVMWNEHPTLQSIMKMVTSSKYRFPTVDCDEAGRDKMKLAEQKAREEVGKRFRSFRLLILCLKLT